SEQIASRAMAMLYVNELAAQAQLAPDGDVDPRIRDTIPRLLARRAQKGDGPAPAGAAGIERLVRLVVGGRRRPLAPRLRHRLPDAGASARLRCAADGLYARDRPVAELRRR